jgi:hypothetical protein
VAGGIAEFLRNLALIAFGAPFVEPLVTGASIEAGRAATAFFWGILFLTISIIFDHERQD